MDIRGGRYQFQDGHGGPLWEAEEGLEAVFVAMEDHLRAPSLRNESFISQLLGAFPDESPQLSPSLGNVHIWKGLFPLRF